MKYTVSSTAMPMISVMDRRISPGIMIKINVIMFGDFADVKVGLSKASVRVSSFREAQMKKDGQNERSLGPLERMQYFVDQRCSANFVMYARIKGCFQKADLAAALASVQSNHHAYLHCPCSPW